MATTTSEAVLVCFQDTDLVALVKALVGSGLVSNFDLNMPRPQQVRYLLLHVEEQLKRDPSLSGRYLDVFSSHRVRGCVLNALEHVSIGTLAASLSATTLSDNGGLEPAARGSGVVTGTKRPHSFFFQEKHVSVLTEILSQRSSKWKEIGISLNLSRNTLRSISAMMHANSSVVCLHEVLTEWVECQHENATLDSLQQALKSRIVHLPKLAGEVQKCVESGMFPDEVSSVKKPRLQEPQSEEYSPAMYAQNLKDMYSAQPEVPKDSWPPVSSHTFINLALIKQHGISNTSKYVRSTIQGDMDDIMKDKESIRYESVFREFQSKSLVLIEGRPGSGKTTLVHKMSQDWANGKDILKGAELVFLVSLRVLSYKGKVKDLKVILELFYRNHVVDISTLQEHINKSNGRGVCFILDGLDEYPHYEYPHYDNGNDIVSDIIHKKYLPLSMVIVASRPVATARLRSQAVEQVEVLGFMKDQIFEYVRKYKFQDQTQTSQGLKTYLDRHRNVLHLCYLPVHTAMVCFLYDQCQLGDNFPSTETEIYKHFTQLTLLRKLKHIADDTRNKAVQEIMEDGPFQKICELAFNMAIHSKQVMHQDELSLSDSIGSDEPSLGLVTVDLATKLYGYKEIYTFLHLTFQEFLAAWHITQLTSQEQMEIIHRYGWRYFMRVVWKFYCGLTDFEKYAHHFNQIISSSRDDLFNIQCAFESQQSITCDSLLKHEGAGCFSFHKCFMTALDFTAIGYVIKNAVSYPVKTLVLDECDFGEDDVIALQKEAGSRISSIKGLYLCVRTYDKESFKSLYGLLRYLSSLEELGLDCSALGREKQELAALSLPHLKILTLNESLCDVEHLKIFRQICGDKLWCIKTFRFPVACVRNNIMEVFGLPVLIHSVTQYPHILGLQGLELDSKSTEILSTNISSFLCSKLVLTNCSIDDRGAKALASGIKHVAKLKTLNISMNKIRDEGAVALAENVKHCSELSMLDLSCNDISDDGALAVAKAVKDFHELHLFIWNCGLTELGVSRIQTFKSDTDTETLDVEDTSAIEGYSLIKELAKMVSILKNCKHLKLQTYSTNIQAVCDCIGQCSSLRTLTLKINSISDDKSELLADSLKQCRNLISLTLEGNGISDKATNIFADNLKFWKNLQVLNLGKYNISSKGLISLANNLSYCSQLQSLNLDKNKIGSEGKKVLAGSLQHCINLRTLSLRDNEIGAEGITVLAESLKHCANLQSLYLADNGIGVDGIKAIAESLKDCVKLQSLDLGGNAMGCDGAVVLAACISHWTNLQTLNIEGNDIGTDGIVALTGYLENLSRLDTLNLNDNKICDDGVKALISVLQCCKLLQSLHLKKNDLSADGIRNLEGDIATLDLNDSIGLVCDEAPVSNLKYCSNLQILNLKTNQISNDGAKALADGLKLCNNLQTLDLGDNLIGTDGAKALAYCLKHCSNLQTLDLGDNVIGTDGAKAFAYGLKYCSNLQTLYLGSNEIGTDGAKALAYGLKHCSNLQTLDLGDNEIGTDGATALADVLKHCSNLQTLDLGNNEIGTDGAMALVDGLKHCSNLQTLDLYRNGIHPYGTKALVDGLKYHSNLQNLDLFGNEIDAKALADGLKHCSNLQTLDLDGNLVCNDGAMALADGLKHCSQLQTLHLCYNNIGTGGARALACCLKNCDNLQTLNLGRNEIGIDGAKAFADGIKDCSSLQTLYLNHNKIDNDGAKALADGLKHCSNLQTLHLDGNEIGSDGAKALADGLKHCSNLQTLNLDVNEIGTDGAKAIADGLKHCSSLQVLHVLYNEIHIDGAKALADGLKHLQILELGDYNIDTDDAD